MNQMRYVWTFFICAALAVGGVILWLIAIIPAGEGAFGIAKMVPFLFLFGSIILFCVIWFPANLGVFLWYRRRRVPDGPKTIVVFSGCVFALCLAAVAMKYISQRHLAHSPPVNVPTPPQQQADTKEIKEIIDGFCARERRGENLTPADGIFATMQQLMWISPTNVVEYTADNLDDKSGFLWVIAGSPNCTPRLFDRFLLLPHTHRFLAANPAAPPQVLEALSHSTNSVVREAVARNRKSPDMVLKQLAADSDQGVRDSAVMTMSQNGR